MPFTPYHFGPSGLLGLLFKHRLDLPVFLLANVAVDIEVLLIAGLDLGYPVHRYAHTLLFGAAWGLAAYPLRPLFIRLMRVLRLPYSSGLRKMLVSGVLGAWAHVLVDAIYHPGVHLLWPSRALPLWRTAYRHITRDQVKDLCVALLVAAIGLYVVLLAICHRRPRPPTHNTPCPAPRPASQARPVVTAEAQSRQSNLYRSGGLCLCAFWVSAVNRGPALR